MKRIGLQSASFEDADEMVCNSKKKQIVKLLVNMIVASNLQGCDGVQPEMATWSLTWEIGVIIILMVLVARLFFKLNEKMMELAKYKMVWKTVREAAHLQREEDPFCCEEGLAFAEDMDEESNMDNDETVSEGDDETPYEPTVPEGDQELHLRRHRVLRREECHGAARWRSRGIRRSRRTRRRWWSRST